jgi:K+-sensing histidine kinase KdpD
LELAVSSDPKLASIEPLLALVRERCGETAVDRILAEAGSDARALENCVRGACELLRRDSDADAQMRREVYALALRDEAWIRRMDGGSDESDPIELVARGMEMTREHWVRVVRTLSHDLRSPLTVIKTNIGFLRDSGALIDDESAEVLDDVGLGVERVTVLLDTLGKVATFEIAGVPLETERIGIEELGARMGRLTSALVRGRPVGVDLRVGSGAPEAIRCDALLLDRVIDGLLTHVAVHTEVGSIAIELDGVDGDLVISISDTSRGVEATVIEQLLDSGGFRRPGPTQLGWGSSLVAAFRLLARLGGHREISSEVGVGTRIRVSIPANSDETPPDSGPPVVQRTPGPG